VRTRAQCEAEITAALASYRSACDSGDETGAEYERIVMDELLDELPHLPQPRKATP
jgi:hypothetical protein